MRTLVVGNWKMHGSQAANADLLKALSDAPDPGFPVAVCVPFPYLHQAGNLLEGSSVGWGAQNLSEHAQYGAYTGEVSGAMLKDFDCRYVLVGHSERRALYGESDALVAVKTEAALASGLVPILCVGETLEERECAVTESVVERQLTAVHQRIGSEALARCVIAYEPVWAIGTGVTATPAQAQAVHAFIRARLDALCGAAVAARTSILYGGSVKPQNAAELFSQPDIDGGLIGGAALVAGDFLAIVAAAAAS
ncbi:triose-phosphate isomerase [Methyloversatilis sp.]|uniref:triose-phosphate isomerase n=1 Tax=Methyloversatilis sp. TaxID=2569862 RepID=UPI002732E57D|nr:triose-phosphate isomerase [Methyloversatilis sp.]MDP2867697.1 triose-phosphate isomerase [Methyloversatilis sp.]MDP3457005.1 triose-phosphate isomerase [Methyloversatilis sp.]MDP3579967.1 triose-phosphate isomerase [Methyloversatilis sp.]